MLSLSDTPNGASFYLALNWRLFPVLVHLILNSVPVLTFRSSPVSRGFCLSISPSVSPPRVKLGLFFIIPHVCRTCSESSSDYATLCVPYHRATWNLFCEFDVLDIATSAMEKRRIRDDGTMPRSYESSSYFSGSFVYFAFFAEILCNFTSQRLFNE